MSDEDADVIYPGGMDHDEHPQESPERDPAQELADEGERALMAHLLDRAVFARKKYGAISNENLGDFLRDSECVRYPTRLIFERGEMAAHQFAQPDDDLRDSEGKGKVLYVDPELRHHPHLMPLAVAYFVPVLNYGEDFVDDRHCTEYGAALFGLTEEDYYERICQLADLLGTEPRLEDE